MHDATWCGAARNDMFRAKSHRPTRKTEPMNLIHDYRNWRRYRNTLNELRALNDRELADLGIGRGDLRRIARSGRR